MKTLATLVQSLLPGTTGAGFISSAARCFPWLAPLAALCVLASPLAADQFGDFTYTDDGTSITVTDYPTSAVGVVDIPATIVGKPVTSIGGFGFYGCSGLTGVTLPASVTTIGEFAFFGCSGVANVILPPGVTNIGNFAFFNCTSLANASFMGNAPTMGTKVFHSAAAAFTVSYIDGTTGFTAPTWLGYPVVALTSAVIATHPASTTINSGSTATLTVTAIGAGPFTYQWYQGASGTTTTPVGTNSASFTTAALSATTSYWVKVTNGVNPTGANSNAATVTITPLPADIGLVHRWSFNDTLDSVGGANLTLVGNASISGSQLQLPGSSTPRTHYASVPIGNTIAELNSMTVETWFTLDSLVTFTKVWAFGTPNGGVQPGFSSVNFAPYFTDGLPRIDFDPTTASSIRSTGGSPNPPALVTGAQYHLVTVYDAPNNQMRYYINGILADIGSMGGSNVGEVGNTTQNFFGAQIYWSDLDLDGRINEVRIWNRPMIHTEVSQNYSFGPDQLPPQEFAFAAQPASTTINSGATTTLTVIASGTAPFTYQWYQGASGDTSTPVGTDSANFTTPALTTATSYWVKVSNAATPTGTDSNTATVTINPLPTITNVRAAQRVGTKLVDIDYDVIGTMLPLKISLEVSSDDGVTYPIPATSLSGAVGANVTPGTNLRLTWDAGKDWGDRFSTTMRYKVVADDAPSAPPGFALIPAGLFQMGDQSSPTVGSGDERPVHAVMVSAFLLGKYEVTHEEWDVVRIWGLANGYTDLAAGNGTDTSKGAYHPVHSITWYDMVKWCNARSQKEGLTPCYTVSGATYTTGQSTPACNWSANGYRLPTEAEWEKAARGGVTGKNFPWGTDTITHSQANYNSSSAYAYDVSATQGYHPSYYTGSFPYSSPVGSFAPNGYGLYDMAGNMWEWCWDWYGASAAGSQTDPRGATTGSGHVFRGGSWYVEANFARCARRGNDTLQHPAFTIGFRLARSSVP